MDKKNIQIRSQVWDQVWKKVEGQIRNQVGSQIQGRVGNEAGSQVWLQVKEDLDYKSFLRYHPWRMQENIYNEE